MKFLALLMISFLALGAEYSVKEQLAAKNSLIGAKKFLKETSQSKIEKVLPKAINVLESRDDFEMAEAMSKIEDSETRKLLVERIEMIQKEEEQLGLVFILDLLISGITNNPRPMYVEACTKWEPGGYSWKKDYHVSQCFAYWFFVVITLDGEELDFE